MGRKESNQTKQLFLVLRPNYIAIYIFCNISCLWTFKLSLCIVGTQKNHLNEMAPLSTQNKCLYW